MKTIELVFGSFEFYPEIVIGKMNSGIHYDLNKNDELVKVVTDFYGYDSPISVISIRENDYSIDPMVHKHNSQYENLCSIAIVNTRENHFNSVELESKFFKPGKLISFESIEEALVWSNKEVSSKIESSNKDLFSLN